MLDLIYATERNMLFHCVLDGALTSLNFEVQSREYHSWDTETLEDCGDDVTARLVSLLTPEQKAMCIAASIAATKA